MFIAGGWDGHKPEESARVLSEALAPGGFQSEIATDLSVLDDAARLASFDLICPCWTMGSLTENQSRNLQEAVRGGVGLGGIHGGMGDAFRGNLDYEWMAGGHFVGHPHVGGYTVRLRDIASTITRGLPRTFFYQSEQYYMLVDPAVQVLADAEYLYDGCVCSMPVAWVRQWGAGRVFYSALGHAPEEFTVHPESLTLAVQGMSWAARDR